MARTVMARTRVLVTATALAVLLAGPSACSNLPSNLPKDTETVRLDPADFTTRIDNPYLPLTPGDERIYRVTDSEGLNERAVATVTDRTKKIANGVTARVVYTVVTEHGNRVQDNTAWYAQDKQGNVWYFGEVSREFEDGRLASTEGSWEAGVRGAQPGVIMPARPKPGLAYREEYAKDVAEDRGRVFSLDERVEVPVRRFDPVLLIKETEGIEPTLLDYKFYAKDVGLVLGVEISGGSGREELVGFRRGSGR